MSKLAVVAKPAVPRLLVILAQVRLQVLERGHADRRQLFGSVQDLGFGDPVCSPRAGGWGWGAHAERGSPQCLFGRGGDPVAGRRLSLPAGRRGKEITFWRSFQGRLQTLRMQLVGSGS